MRSSEIFLRSLNIRDLLKSGSDSKENPIDSSLLPVLPFRILNEIKIIIIGQDPTVKNEKSRRSIEYTLNLDKNGSLKAYISDIAAKLGLVFENIYATNVFKYFYSFPPERTMNVLYQHLEPNLDLLKEELSAYPKAAIITLGLPVLRLLSDRDDEVYKYWDYDKKTHETLGRFACCKASKNNLGRDIYPLPHQPSLVKEFYKGNLDGYLKYVRNEIRK